MDKEAPDFELRDQNNEVFRLYDHLDQIVVFFFYTKDNTAGCTAEACAFRDQYEMFQEAGAEIVGVSSDDIKTHQDFSQKHRLPFPLLSDPEGKVRHLYGVKKWLGILPGRETFVISRSGKILLRFNSMLNFKQHSKKALKLIQTSKVNSERD